MAVVGALVGTLAVFAPVALAGVFGRPSPVALGPNPDLGEPWSRAAVASAPAERHLRVDPVDPGRRRRPARRRGRRGRRLRRGAPGPPVQPPGGRAAGRVPGAAHPFLIDALRQSPLDKLDRVELARISPETFMLSGEVSGGSRTSVKFRLDDPRRSRPSAPVIGPETRETLGSADRALQLVQYGDLFGVRQSDGMLSLLVDQPPMARRTVVGDLPSRPAGGPPAPDLRTGAPAVAVSKDQGRHWLARSLNAPQGIDAPTVTTLDGTTAHAFIRYSKGIRHLPLPRRRRQLAGGDREDRAAGTAEQRRRPQRP